MRLLLDTQVFLYAGFGNPAKIPARATKLLADKASELFISAASIFELEILIRKGRINSTQAKIEAGLNLFGVKMLPFAARHAFETFNLPDHHSDPFDRMIIATALVEDLHLIGGDEQFPKYKGLKLIWR